MFVATVGRLGEEQQVLANAPDLCAYAGMFRVAWIANFRKLVLTWYRTLPRSPMWVSEACIT